MSSRREGTDRAAGEHDEALGDAADAALDATDVDPTGNVVDNDAVERKERSAEDG